MYSPSLAAAAATWDDPNEPVEITLTKIHDGVPLELLNDRAEGYTSHILEDFRLNLPTGAHILEIGSGVGYIMEGVNRRLQKFGTPPSSITGLDIAPNMLAKARERLDGKGPYCFQIYDGVTIPLPAESLDLIYSVAVLQHIPKPFVYNLFFESKRLLKAGGFGFFHFMNFRKLRNGHYNELDWHREVQAQVNNEKRHWHHLYTREEVYSVLKHGTGFTRVDIDDADELLVCVKK